MVLHRNALGERRPAARPVGAVERVPHRRVERGFRPHHLDPRPHRARRDRVAGDQPAAADRDHQHVEIGDLLQHLQRDRALAGDDQGVVVGVDPGQVALLRERGGARLRLGNALALEHDLRAIGPGRRHLHVGRRLGHHDGGRNAEARRVVGDRLSVVAGRHGDHAARALRGIERGELGHRAALLERVRYLQVLVFDEHLGAGQRGELGRRQHGRAQDLAGNDPARGFDIGERDHVGPDSYRDYNCSADL